jgi:hypothetical protein
LGLLVEVAPEQPLELAGRHADVGGEDRGGDRLLEVLLHHVDHGGELGVAHADPGRDRQPLLVGFRPHPGVDHLVGDDVGELRPVLPGDQPQHQVGRRRAAGRGVAVAVDHVDVRQ